MPKNSEKWLRVIGIGEDGWEDLEADAKLLLYESQVVLGGERHLKCCRMTGKENEYPGRLRCVNQ